MASGNENDTMRMDPDVTENTETDETIQQDEIDDTIGDDTIQHQAPRDVRKKTPTDAQIRKPDDFENTVFFKDQTAIDDMQREINELRMTVKKNKSTINDLNSAVVTQANTIDEKNYELQSIKFKLPPPLPPQLPQPKFGDSTNLLTSTHIKQAPVTNIPVMHLDKSSTPPQQQSPFVNLQQSVPQLQPTMARSSSADTTAQKQQPPFVKWTMTFDRNKTTLSNYISYFVVHAQLNEYTEQQKCQQLLKSFGMDALRLAQRLGAVYTFESLVEVLYQYYEPKESKQAKQLKLNTIIRSPKESARDFANRVQDLVSTCFSSISPNELDEMVIARFVQGHHQSAKASLLARPFKSIDEAVNHVDMLEASKVITQVSQATPDGENTSNSCKPVTATGKPASTKCIPSYTVDTHEEEDNHIPDVDAILDVYTTSIDVVDNDEDDALEFLATKIYRKFPKARNTMKCFYCGAPGHSWMKCYRLLAQLQKRGFRPSRRQNFKQPQIRSSMPEVPSRAQPQDQFETRPRRPFIQQQARPKQFRKRMPNRKVSSFFESMFDTFFADDVSEDETADKEDDAPDDKVKKNLN